MKTFLKNHYKKIILIILLIAISASVIIVLAFRNPKEESKQDTKTQNIKDSIQKIVPKEKDSPPLLKNIGFKLEAYDASTGMAGDFKFTNANIYNNRVFHDFGEFIADNRNGGGKRNPQVSFSLPVGTKITAMTDGVVQGTQTLWSGDYLVTLTI